MNLYDGCFAEIDRLLDGHTPRTKEGFPVWEDAGQNQILFRSDTAYELRGKNLPAVSSVIFTDDAGKVGRDEVFLYGPDLPEIKADSPYARIAMIRVNSETIGSGEKLYSAIRKIEYTRYHINPDGYMMRISAMTQRECVRIGSRALEAGLSFFGVGRLFVDAYRKHKDVENVKLIFITEPGFPYGKLMDVAKRSENITKALDHLVNKLKMDCDICRLKDICSEVEELYKKDFGNQGT